MTKSLKSHIDEHNERVRMNRYRTPMKVFIGGSAFGIIIGAFASAVLLSSLMAR